MPQPHSSLHIAAHLLWPHRVDLLPFLLIPALLAVGAIRGISAPCHILPRNVPCISTEQARLVLRLPSSQCAHPWALLLLWRPLPDPPPWHSALAGLRAHTLRGAVGNTGPISGLETIRPITSHWACKRLYSRSTICRKDLGSVILPRGAFQRLWGYQAPGDTMSMKEVNTA